MGSNRTASVSKELGGGGGGRVPTADGMVEMPVVVRVCLVLFV